jgi:hypothetical protein
MRQARKGDEKMTEIERTLIVQECAEWKIEVVIDEMQTLKECPDLMHTQAGMDLLYSVKNVVMDLIEWLEEKKRNPGGLHVLPGGTDE